MRRALVVAALLLAAAGCTPEATPNLLRVLAVTPERVDEGDRIELFGEGFPEGKRGRITFRGDLHAPGRPVDSGVDVTLSTSATALNRVSAVLTEQARQQFCGDGNDARSTTFRGSVSVSFAPNSPGAPPVSGTLDRVVLEVHAPSPPPGRLVEIERTAKRHAEIAGLKLGRVPATGVTIQHAASLAAAAGLLPGDVLVALDGAAVHDVSDFRAPGDDESIVLTVRRQGLDYPFQVTLTSPAYRRSAPAQLSAALATGLVALVLLGLMVVRRSSWVAWFERHLDRQATPPAVRSPVEVRPTVNRVSFPRRWLADLGEHLSPLSTLAFGGSVALWTAIAFGGEVLTGALDLVLVAGVSATAWLVAALVAGGHGQPGDWSLRHGLKAASRAALHRAVSWLSLCTALVTAGSLRLTEIVGAQGAWPHRWSALSHPSAWLGLCLFLVMLVPDPRRAEGPLLDADPGPRRVRRRPSATYDFCAWLDLWLMAGLASALFLGGWRMPSTELSSGWTPLMAGAILQQFKTLVIVGAVIQVRRLLGGVSLEHALRPTLVALAPMALSAATLSIVWAIWVRGSAERIAAGAMHIALPLITLLLLAVVVRRVLLARRHSASPAPLNTWL